jgi:plastocyanin
MGESRRRIRGCVRAGALTAAVAGALAPGAHAANAEVVVGQSGDRFSPSSVTINVGDTVTWRWADSDHNVVIDDAREGFDAGYRRSGETYARTFSNAGTYEFYCDPHRDDGMRGTLVVQPSSSPPPPPPPPPSGGTTGTAPAGGTAPTGTAAAVDRAAPVLSLLRARVVRRVARLRLRLDERSAVRVTLRRAGARRAARTRRFTGTAGVNALRLSVRGLRRGRYRVRVVATDAAGNRSPARTRTIVIRR